VTARSRSSMRDRRSDGRRKPCPAPPEDLCGRRSGIFVPVQWVLREAGVSHAAFREWRLERNYTRCPYYRKVGKCAYVRAEVAKEYLDNDGVPRVAKRPARWLTSQRAQELSGQHVDTLTAAARRGELRAVKYKGRLYFEPDLFQAYLRRRSIPEGWLSLADIARRTGLHTRTVLSRAKALGIQARVAPDPRAGGRRVNWYAPLDAAQIIEYKDILERPPEGWVHVSEEAERRGWSAGAVQNWLRRYGHPTVLARQPDARVAPSRYCPPESWQAYVEWRERWEAGILERPPEGWVHVSEEAERNGWSVGATHNWLRRYGHKTVPVRQPDDPKATPVRYCSPEAWRAYVEWRTRRSRRKSSDRKEGRDDQARTDQLHRRAPHAAAGRGGAAHAR